MHCAISYGNILAYNFSGGGKYEKLGGAESSYIAPFITQHYKANPVTTESVGEKPYHVSQYQLHTVIIIINMQDSIMSNIV